MKTGRNDPCPCGSGKKYKRCCLYNKDANPHLSVQQSEDENEILGLQETFQRMMFNMRKRVLERKPHIQEYTKIRKMHSEIGNSMMQYYENGTFIHNFNTSGQYKQGKSNESKMLRLINSSFDLDTKIGVHAFYDMMMYKITPNANCITEDFINNKRYRKPEKIELLQSMLDSKLGLFEITGTEPDEGYADIRDVFTGGIYRIIDIGLSGNENFNVFIYTRIITFREISFSTGLNIIFNKTDPFIQGFIRREKDGYSPLGEFVRFTELYNRFSKDQKGIKMATNTY